MCPKAEVRSCFSYKHYAIYCSKTNPSTSNTRTAHYHHNQFASILHLPALHRGIPDEDTMRFSTHSRRIFFIKIRSSHHWEKLSGDLLDRLGASSSITSISLTQLRKDLLDRMDGRLELLWRVQTI